ncbi:hypothetical protein [Nostoc sp. 2RC]|uniref:hypothetical protein n=1 Tax=Nostoc sp. 2RC TaxID=2485484 RepID=UPI00162903D6|nr:hypothetical protein [Nostoc sp. 2RC]MBC1235745.1 hypothetical protein [Nostoc sp. 2RC]
MTSLSSILQPLLDISSVINTIYLFAALCLGVFAAWSKEAFFFAIILVVLFVSVVSKITYFAPAISNNFNNLFIFLIIGYSVSTGIKLAFNRWRGY